ncbi:MAG TPA: GNAT family N-acetyltransferase [Candidatus Ornithomonoglobus intestinigallinarum]|uniref:GNAT family N-acetyltransferase n=1 Tax=Candidatus Ornithomonoglobus intestinigallinarum TaxID=2840894 RepID=A0A9D1H1P4_9FIRM|nr:GNAT family N-acetyltransferase [Candidatus Ornithomonoglobus intestinigallinarum]
MELCIKHYNELTLDELYDIIKLRIEVFVVEQNCPYRDLDDKDKNAYHVFLRDSNKLLAYVRVLDKHVSFEEASIGRVISGKRRCGYGTRVLAAGIKTAEERFGADVIKIAAQTYAEEFYKKSGFRRVSEEFLEDGIPHILMIYKKDTF